MKRFNLYIALFSLVLDAVAIFVGLWIAYVLRADGRELFQWPLDNYLQFAALVTPVWALLFASLGMYNPDNPVRGWQAARNIFIGVLSGWALMVIALYLWRSPEAQNFPRLIIVYGFFLTLVFVWFSRFIMQTFVVQLYRSGIGVARTAVITRTGNGIVSTLESSTSHGKKVVEVIQDAFVTRLNKLVKKTRIDEIFVADPNIDEETLLSVLDFAQSRNLAFTLVPSLLSVRTTNVEMATMASVPVMIFRRSPLEGWGRVYKRIFDLVLVIPAIIILSPLMLLAFILAQISTGSAIFIQERVGQDGKIFRVHKFRSMYVDGDERFPEFKGWSADENTDPRIPKIGRFLRKTNLNELAQLWDILIGTMSLVGPRPEQPKYVEKFAQEIPGYLKRHHVKSGLTGWAQINGLRGNTPVEERVKYDLYYIENWSIWLDLRIILGTFVYMLKQLLKST